MPELGLKTKRNDRPAARGAGSDNAALIDLIKRAKRGDRTALYDLCAESMKFVYFLALRFADNNADAEDVMQESLLYVCQKIGELREPAAYASWLSRVVISLSREYYNKNTKHGVVLDIDDYLENITENNVEFLPEEHVENAESRKAILEIIDGLPVRQREAVVLCYYGGLSVTEAAEEMGVGKANVSYYLTLARRKLKGWMETNDLAPTGSTVKLHSTGLIMIGLLNRDTGLLPLDNTIAEHVMEQCAAAIQTKAAPVLAGAGKLKPAVLPLAMVSVMVATVAATVFYSITRLPQMTPTETPPSSATVARQAIESVIVFSGGEDRGEGNAHLNPSSAQIMIPDGDGTITVTQWWITPSGSEEVLFQGTGEDDGSMEEAFARLRAEDGVYVVWFRLTDQAGFLHHKHRNFRVDGG